MIVVGHVSSSKDVRESRCTCQPTLPNPHLLSPCVHDHAHVRPLTHCSHLPHTTCSTPIPPHFPLRTCRPAGVHDRAQVFRNRPHSRLAWLLAAQLQHLIKGPNGNSLIFEALLHVKEKGSGIP